MGTGTPGTIWRSFSSGPENFFRVNEDERIRLEVKFKHPQAKAAVTLFTNINNHSEEWYELPFRFGDSHTFYLDVKCSKPGRYCFKVKYTLDGHKWLWDCVPFSYVMIDPSLHSTIKTYSLVTTSAGNISDWTRMLPHVREVGCNVLHLLPVTRMGNSEAPYAAKDLFSIDPAYMDPASDADGITQFSRFVDIAAEQDIHVCIDLVFNHVSEDSNISRICPEWIQADENEADGFKRAGWSSGDAWHKWDNLILLDYDHPDEKVRKALWDYMCQYGLFWAQFAARTKGMIRLDNLHSSNHQFTRHVLGEIRKAYPDILVFAELFTDTATSSKLVWNYGLDLMLATPWEHHFVPQLRKYLEEVHRRDTQTPHILPITSHDSGTPAQEFGSIQATIPRYAISALMGCGATGLVQGVEYGLSKKLSLVGVKPVPDYNTGHDFTPFIAKINRIMDEHSVFQAGGNLRFVDGGHDAIMAVHRFDPAKSNPEFLVICNLDIFNQQTISIDLHASLPGLKIDSLEDLLTGSIMKPANGKLELLLPPCGVLALKIPA